MKNKTSKIHYADLYGEREEKFAFLESHTVKNTKWQILNAKEPHYFFVPKDFSLGEEYNKFVSVKDIFKNYNAGIATGKDEVLVANNKNELVAKLSVKDEELFKAAMKSYKLPDKLIKNWMIELKNIDLENQIENYNYRIFDKKFVIYNNKILQRARDILMKHLLKDNLSLVTTKILSSQNFKHIFVSDFIGDRCLISNRGREANYYFPLYLYPQKQNKTEVFKGQKKLDLGGQKELDENENNSGKISNIKPEILTMLKEKFGKKVSAEDVFNYIYAVLYSNQYREKYQEFLKIDFPRVPFTKDYEVFKKISKIGESLIELHLLKDKSLEKGTARFMGVGADNVVRKREYDEKENKIWINNEKYFDAVEPEVWNYYIGGYQVLDKWLKDRLGRELSREEISHYLKVIECLKQTMKIQKKIDENL